jgi:AraC family transcriptional regulator
MLTSARQVHQNRQRLLMQIGKSVSRFQDGSTAFDDVAAEILALDRNDLPCMTMLLFGGPASADDLSTRLRVPRSRVAATLERLQLAGYARFQPGPGARLELTEHARDWIARIWAPLQREGNRLLERYSTRQLSLMAVFMDRVCDVQESRARRLAAWLALPSSPTRAAQLRGGLSPAAFRRVQVYVEANLAHPIHLRDMAARAGLSPYHFARAFRASAGLTPRAFVEDRRIALVKRLLSESGRSLAEIALDAGFSTQSRLTTTFRRRTGFTPGAYRRGRGPS